MKPHKSSVIIVGGGMVGLNLALALAQAQHAVTLIEAREPVLDWSSEHYDARVSAINLKSRDFLQQTGCWAGLCQTSVTPFDSMQVWDDLGGGEVHFNHRDIREAQLGFIVENRAIIKSAWALAEQHPLIEMRCPAVPEALSVQADQASLTLQSGEVLSADWVIGVDGARSWVREQGGFRWRERSYRQRALVAVVQTEKPHQACAYQNFLVTGPLGVLPLHDPHQVSIVWSCEESRATALMELAEDDFNRELTNALGCRLGDMHCLSARQSIPLTMRHCDEYVKPHLVLVGDALHTIHPLAGQGVNLGFADANCLARNMNNLSRYQRQRKVRNQMMLIAMRGFRELFAETQGITVSLRSVGLNLVNRIQPLKWFFTRLPS